MSAGEVQLAALGMQDVFLTGSPQVTYFKGVYRRHTPFSVQSFNIPFQNQNINWGSQAICRIPFKGDMIQSTTLAVTLPLLFPYSTQYKWPIPATVQSPQPYLYFNGFGPFTTSIGVQSYFVVPPPSPSWIGGGLTANISFSSSLGQFVLSSTVNTVSVKTADLASVATFWGLDPNGFSGQGVIGSQPVTTWSFPGGGPTNFTVAQSGWIQYNPSATPNASNSLLYVGPSPLRAVPAVTTPSIPQFNLPLTYVNFSAFSSVVGYTTFFSNTAVTQYGGGNIKFNYPGTYAFIITPTGVSAPTRIGVFHNSTTDRPLGGWTYDYVYTYNVQFTGQNPRAVLPFYVSDPTQYYFLDFEGTPSTAVLASDATVIVTDVNEFWALPPTSNSTLVNNTVLLTSGFIRNGPIPQITANTLGNTFNFTSSGLYNLYGTISVGASNTVSYVLLCEQFLSGPTGSKANVIAQWNSPQASSPTVNFTLPVQVLNPTNNNYSLVIGTRDVAGPIGNLISTSSLTVEYFGSNTFFTSHQNDYRQNGLLLNATSGTNYPLGLANVNLYSLTTTSGSSFHEAVLPSGNLRLSNVSQYKISSYFETSNAYVSNVSVWAGTDAVLATGGGTQVASRTLPLGMSGGYTLDLIVPVLTPSITTVYQVRMGLAGTIAGQQTTNVTSNAYFTVLGVTGTGVPLSYSYVDSVGTYLIQSAELRMGGQLIQTLTGEMIEIYNDLRVAQENQPGLTLLTGKLDSSYVYNDRTYYINLPFFFYGQAELSLPICALPLQDLEIWINFNNFQSLLLSANQAPTPLSVITSMIIDYAYLSEPEIQWFMTHRQDYIITQIQYDTFFLNGSLTFRMDFLGSVRELFFVIQDSTDAVYSYDEDPGIGITIKFNGEDFVDSSTLDYHFSRFIAPLQSYIRQPDRKIHMIPLCREPLNPRPSGSVNMSRIYQKTIQFTLPTLTSLATKTLRLMAVSYNILRVENGLSGIMYQ